MITPEWIILFFGLGYSLGAYIECQSTLKKLQQEDKENPA